MARRGVQDSDVCRHICECEDDRQNSEEMCGCDGKELINGERGTHINANVPGRDLKVTGDKNSKSDKAPG